VDLRGRASSGWLLDQEDLKLKFAKWMRENLRTLSKETATE
jgi:hypothetical protein